MISDTLSDAVHSIQTYLNDETFDDVYRGVTRERIEWLISMMTAMREQLDALPAPEGE